MILVSLQKWLFATLSYGNLWKFPSQPFSMGFHTGWPAGVAPYPDLCNGLESTGVPYDVGKTVDSKMSEFGKLGGKLKKSLQQKKMDPKHQHYSRLKNRDCSWERHPAISKASLMGCANSHFGSLEKMMCSVPTRIWKKNRTKCRSHWDWTSFSFQIHQVFAKGGALSQDADSSSKD